MKKRMSIWMMILLMLLLPGCGALSTEPEPEETNAPTETTEETKEAFSEDDIERYRDVLNFYYQQAEKGWRNAASSEWEICYLYYEYPFFHSDGRPSKVEEIGYTLVDLDEDGTAELIVNPITSEGDEAVIYDLFALSGDGTPVHLISSTERETYELCEDNTVIYRGSGGFSTSIRTHYAYRDGGWDMQEFLLVDGFLDGTYQEPTEAYYGKDVKEEAYKDTVNSGKEAEFVKENMQPIPLEEADQIEATWPKTREITLIPLSEYDADIEEEEIETLTGEVEQDEHYNYLLSLYYDWAKNDWREDYGTYSDFGEGEWTYFEYVSESGLRNVNPEGSGVPLEYIGYLLTDVDGDGTRELLIGCLDGYRDETDQVIVDMYTFDVERDKVFWDSEDVFEEIDHPLKRVVKNQSLEMEHWKSFLADHARLEWMPLPRFPIGEMEVYLP